MKTSLINFNNKQTFKGIYNKDDRTLLGSDLDGTLTKGNSGEIQEVLKTADNIKAIKAYVTGRTKKSFYKEQQELAQKGIILPNPDYLISNDGQYIDYKLDNMFIRDIGYKNKLKETTHFDRNEVIDTIYKLGHTKKYLLNPEKYENLDDLEKRKNMDPKNWNSKITYYEWNASDFKTEFIIADDVDMNELQKDISKKLAQKGIKVKFIVEQFIKPIIDKCPENIKLQCQPTREDKDGGVRVLYVSAADKADALEYIRKKENIKHKEVITAGDGLNDESLLDYSVKTGGHFISVANSHPQLLNKVKEMQSLHPKNVILSENEGTKGVEEGVNKIISNAKNKV